MDDRGLIAGRVSQSADIVRHIATSSALNPSLIALAIIAIPSLALSNFASPPLSDYLFYLVAATTGVVLLQIAFFTIFDRDRLQSEKHVEHKILLSQQRFGVRDGNNTREIEIGHQGLLTENPESDSGARSA